MGILRYVPRTEGVSTSTLIKRIQARYEEDGADQPKDKQVIRKTSLPPALSCSPAPKIKKKNK